MAKGQDTGSEMTHAGQSDGINVIFDQRSPPSSRSRSRSSCDNSYSSESGRYRGRGSYRRRYRSSSSSSSSSSRSSSRPRSRSHPRCHRHSSRCRCDNHRRFGRGCYRRSSPRHYRPHSRSYSRSPDRYSHRRRYRSRSRCSGGWSRNRKAGSPIRCQFSRSSRRTYRSRSRSRSSGGSVSLSLDDKRALLTAAKANGMKILNVEKLELPKSVKPILSEQCEETMVRQDHEKTPSQSSDVEPDLSSPKMSPKKKIISFSINNSVAKPIVAAPSSAKVTPRVDSYNSRKPYGHWVRIRSRQTSNARKHTLNTSR